MDQTTEAVVKEEQPAQPDVQTTTTLSSDQPQAEVSKVDFKSLIPDAYKEEKALQNFQDMDGFVKSYLHSQKLVGSDKIPIPNKYATDEDWNAVYEKLGKPTSPDGYEYNLPKEAKLDENSLKAFSTEAHKLGLLPKQAQGIIKYYNDLAGASETEANTKAEAARTEAEKNLRKEFGSTFNDRITAAKKLATSTLGNEFLNNTLLQDGSKLGDNPTVVKAFADLAAQMSEDNIIKGDAPAYMSEKEINRQIASLQQPGSAYWDKKHPSHADVVAEVQDLIRKKNNEQDVE
tara:strand:+ start:425 stop:1294 length:870 start_codon:yes stop_codon:yes gene_type:complete